MASGTGVRSTRKPHWITILVTVFVAATLIVANLDGYHNHLFSRNTTFADDPRAEGLFMWAHGWPWYFMSRVPHDPPPPMGRWTAASWESGFTSRWPFDDARALFRGVTPLVLDCVCFVVLVLGTAYASHQFARRYYVRNTFGLKTLFAATAIVAVAACFGPTLFDAQSRYLLYYTSLAVAAGAAVLALFSVGHIGSRVFRRHRAAAAASPSSQ
jgi:hypothetical protein